MLRIALVQNFPNPDADTIGLGDLDDTILVKYKDRQHFSFGCLFSCFLSSLNKLLFISVAYALQKESNCGITSIEVATKHISMITYT